MMGLISKVVPKMFSLFLRMLLQSLAYNDFNLRGKWHAFIKQNPQILGKALAINTHFTLLARSGRYICLITVLNSTRELGIASSF